MGSRNHEVVPTPLIVQISGLRGGSGVHRSISTLAKTNLIAKVKNAKCMVCFPYSAFICMGQLLYSDYEANYTDLLVLKMTDTDSPTEDSTTSPSMHTKSTNASTPSAIRLVLGRNLTLLWLRTMRKNSAF